MAKSWIKGQTIRQKLVGTKIDCPTCGGKFEMESGDQFKSVGSTKVIIRCPTRDCSFLSMLHNATGFLTLMITEDAWEISSFRSSAEII